MLVEIGGSQAHKHPCGPSWWPFLAEPHSTCPAPSWRGTLEKKLLWGWDGEGWDGIWAMNRRGRKAGVERPHCSDGAREELGDNFLNDARNLQQRSSITTPKEIKGTAKDS